ncbi:MAG: hypothetical protein ACYC3Q_01630 [Gemmatimonadaceae bacterium]
MNVREWLDSRAPQPPAALRARLESLLHDGLERPASQLPEQAVARAGDLVRELLDQARTGRESALDLLAADALVTYAFEAAADEPALLAGRARAALDFLA